MVIWIYVDTLAWYEASSGEFRVKRRLEEASGEPCLALHLSQATPFVVRESHVCEIKRLPACFDLIATNENCRVQAIRHRDRPLWGTQFHPELYQEAAPHGRAVLRNFFGMAGCGPRPRP